MLCKGFLEFVRFIFTEYEAVATRTVLNRINLNDFWVWPSSQGPRPLPELESRPWLWARTHARGSGSRPWTGAWTETWGPILGLEAGITRQVGQIND